MKRPNLHVSNKLKLRCFLIIFCLLLLLSSNMFLRPGIAKELGEEKYIEVYIKPGDTLWHLARKFGNSNKDVRKIVFEICEINHLDTLNIYPGQIIKIPTQ